MTSSARTEAYLLPGDLRMFVVVSNGNGHPFLISFLLWESRCASYTQDNWQQDEAMQSSGQDECQPHAEIVDLQTATWSNSVQDGQKSATHLEKLGASESQYRHTNQFRKSYTGENLNSIMYHV